MNEQALDNWIHDLVLGSESPQNAHQIYRKLVADGKTVSLNDVKASINRLVSQHRLVDANIPSYFALG
jgi:hypothetical protein